MQILNRKLLSNTQVSDISVIFLKNVCNKKMELENLNPVTASASGGDASHQNYPPNS